MHSDSAFSEQSLAGIWAKKYVQQLSSGTRPTAVKLGEGRSQTAEKLGQHLRFCSSRAWAKTESLLFQELQKHGISAELIDPWRIADDSRQLFEQAATNYQAEVTPERFSVIIAPKCGEIRRHYTATDPRILGFLSMQFHYTGQFLLEELTLEEKSSVVSYFKVMDDNLYMPLHRSYQAAAQYSYGAPALAAVQQLLPLSTTIAEFISLKVANLNPTHRCFTGPLSHPDVTISSIRDIEMFQIYLCLCVLEGNIAAVQQELFPLCVMLYPPLNVQWTLVRQLVRSLEQEIHKRLSAANVAVFQPYLAAFREMFSEDIFPQDSPIWSYHPEALRFMGMAREILHDVLNQQEPLGR